MAVPLNTKINNLIMRANQGNLSIKRCRDDMRVAKEALGGGLINTDTYRTLQKLLLKLETKLYEKNEGRKKRRELRRGQEKKESGS